jgi:hypothetical protein
MDKNQLLAEIKNAAASGAITKDEVLNALAGTGSASNVTSVLTQKDSEKTRLRVSVSEVIQYIGGGIVFFGIAILVANNWSSLNEVTKIIATLGSALVALGIGQVLHRREKTAKLGIAFLLISLLLIPLGVYIALDAFGIKFTSYAQTISYEIALAAIYAICYLTISKKLYIVPLTAFLTSVFFSATNYLMSPLLGDSYLRFYEYRFLVVGISYVLLGRYFTSLSRQTFPALFYFFGSIMILGASLALGSWRPIDPQSIFWEIFYPLLVFGGIFFGIYVRQTKMLILAAIFLMIYILKITGEYFSSGLGWPLALVLAGLLMIAVGYLSVYINRRYIRRAA